MKFTSLLSYRRGFLFTFYSCYKVGSRAVNPMLKTISYLKKCSKEFIWIYLLNLWVWQAEYGY